MPRVSRSPALRLYGWFTRLAQPLLKRKLRKRAKAEPGYAHAVAERFGVYDPALQIRDACWVHAVSLGETRAAGILIAELRRQLPGVPILLTHGTATGREEGAKLLQDGDVQVWQPWDTPKAVAAFLDRFRPRIGVLMETEVWPELTAACAQRGIPLTLANARLSEKSLAKAERWSSLARPAYASLAAVWAQSEADAHRLVSLGAKLGGVFGNLKFDAQPDARQLVHAQALRARLPKPVVVFASSRDGEEAMLLDALRHFWTTAPSSDDFGPAAAADGNPGRPRGERARHLPRLRACDVQWLIVPRHPQRFDAVAELIAQRGFACVRRSTAEGAPEGEEIWLGDSLGEMALYYGLSEAALLGGSFAPLGGQNLIEAAACACPIVMGPSTFNFAEAAELAIAAGGALRVDDMMKAVVHALSLVADKGRCAAMSQAALGFAGGHRGAAERTAAAILALGQSVPDPEPVAMAAGSDTTAASADPSLAARTESPLQASSSLAPEPMTEPMAEPGTVVASASKTVPPTGHAPGERAEPVFDPEAPLVVPEERRG